MRSAVDLPPMIEPSAGSTIVFVVIVIAVASALVGAVARGFSGSSHRGRAVGLAAAGVAAVMAASAAVAASGLARSVAYTPASMPLVAVWMLIAIGVAISPVGRRVATQLPLAALVGFHAFRLPLELVLHRWHEEGAIPIQMTFAGDNYDIISGILAVIVGLGLWRGKLGRAAVWIFNVVGFGLLLAVMTIAVLSSPVPLQTYDTLPVLQLGLYVPYVWIVSICVAGALLGHIVVFRRLIADLRGAL